MSGISTNGAVGINGTHDQKIHITPPEMSGLSLSTKAIHADDFLNVNQDVAPALHVSTTFRYSKNPDKLIPSHQLDVRSALFAGPAIYY